jgi:NAD-dependent dihydropyrimidine dehydrogenase PreA subunit
MTPVTDICPFCPRLCRHVCPVAVASARESATPTAIVSVLRLAKAGQLDRDLAEAALYLCNGCGACARHCSVGMDVAAFVRECRSPPAVAPLPELPSGGSTLRVRVGPGTSGGAVALTPDALGHAAVVAGDRAHVARVASHFAGRRVLTDSHAVLEVLLAADKLLGGRKIGVVLDVGAGTNPRFLTCWEGATGADGQLSCCGAREGFEERNAPMAHAMAEEVVRRMGGRAHGCGDGNCSRWLREHGGSVEGPDADVSS